MKKLFLFLLILPLAFFACGDDDDNGTTPKNEDDMTIEEYMSETRKFKWTGDWNDPTDPLNTNPNKDKVYNPIKGYWKSETNIVFCYTEDFEYIRYEYDKAEKTLTFTRKHSYIINNRTIKTIAPTSQHNPLYFTYGVSTNGEIMYFNDHGGGQMEDGDEISRKNWDKFNRFDITGLEIK